MSSNLILAAIVGAACGLLGSFLMRFLLSRRAELEFDRATAAELEAAFKRDEAMRRGNKKT